MGSKKGRNGKNKKKKIKLHFTEERDRIQENFDAICKYAESVGIHIDEDNISWDNGFWAIDITVNLENYRIENYVSGYIWLHENTRMNHTRKKSYHKEFVTKSYTLLLDRMSTHHGFKNGDRCDTNKNYASRKIEQAYEKI